MTAVRVRYDDRSYRSDFHGSYVIRVAQEGRSVTVTFDPDKKLARGGGKIEVSKSIAKRLGLALLRASLEDEKLQNLEIRDDVA